MRLIGTETPKGLQFVGLQAEAVQEVLGTYGYPIENNRIVIPRNQLWRWFPKLLAVGHAVGVLNPFTYFQKEEY